MSDPETQENASSVPKKANPSGRPSWFRFPNKPLHRRIFLQQLDLAEKTILKRAILVVGAIGLAIALIVIIPLYLDLKQQNENELGYILESRRMLVQQSLENMTNVALQITSRTKIRDELVLYNQGKVTLQALQNYSADKLKDALRSSGDALGMIRLDATGQPVLSVGDAVPLFLIEDAKTVTKASIRGPLLFENRKVLIVIAPIETREGGRVGTDAVMYRVHSLEAIVKDRIGLGSTGEVFLGNIHEGEYEPFFSSARNGVPLPGFRIERGSDALSIVPDEGDPGFVYRFTRIEKTDWVLLVRKQSSELNSILNRNMVAMGIVIILLIVSGGAGVHILIRPLLVALTEELALRKKIERELRQNGVELARLNRELEKRVEEEVDRRRKGEYRLIQQSRLASLGQMLGAIAHQWRQPLNALGIIVQDFQEAYDQGEMDGAYLHTNISQALRLIQNMSNTIDDFRNFFRPRTSRESFPLLRVLEEIQRIVSIDLDSNHIHLVVECLREDQCRNLEIVGYSSELKHVILNMIQNSREAILERMRKKALENGVIRIQVLPDETEVFLRISDNGGGIPPEIMDRIFEPYFSTREEGRGTGIGLYMAKMIVEKSMGGTIQAMNDGEGAVFELRLPFHWYGLEEPAGS